MRQLDRTSFDYIFAGLTTLARQSLFQLDSYFDLLRSSDGVTQRMFNTSMHTARIAEGLSSKAISHAVFLTEQQAFPILLQLSLEDSNLIASTLEEEERQLAILESIMPVLATLNPLAWMAYGNFIEGFKAQMTCHHNVLEYFGESWQWLTKTVKEVIDGDTIYVYGLEDSIRFMGIDCPEIWHEGDTGAPGDKRYKAGRKAASYTRGKLLHNKIKIKLYTKKDLYGRWLAKVYLGGKSFETELVREGHAKFKYYG